MAAVGVKGLIARLNQSSTAGAVSWVSTTVGGLAIVGLVVGFACHCRLEGMTATTYKAENLPLSDGATGHCLQSACVNNKTTQTTINSPFV